MRCLPFMGCCHNSKTLQSKNTLHWSECICVQMHLNWFIKDCVWSSIEHLIHSITCIFILIHVMEYVYTIYMCAMCILCTHSQTHIELAIFVRKLVFRSLASFAKKKIFRFHLKIVDNFNSLKIWNPLIFNKITNSSSIRKETEKPI